MRLWLTIFIAVILCLSGFVSAVAMERHDDHEHDHDGAGLILAFFEDQGAHIEQIGVGHHHHDHDDAEHGHDGAAKDHHDAGESHHTGHIHLGVDNVPALPQSVYVSAHVHLGATYPHVDERVPDGVPTSFLRPPTFNL